MRKSSLQDSKGSRAGRRSKQRSMPCPNQQRRHKCVDYPVIDPQLRDRESLLSADMALETHDEIKQLFLEFQTAGVRFFQTLRKEPWGANTFIVKDPDGNLLLFAGPAN